MDHSTTHGRQPSPAARHGATPLPAGVGLGYAPPPSFATTPMRNPPLHVEHTPPAHGQLTWPSVHRSRSSVTTRDSSRRSEGGDRHHSARGGRPGSVSLGSGLLAGPRRSRAEDGVRTSATGIPLLVDVSEMGRSGVGGAGDGSSAAHSHATTAACTPRERTTSPPVEELEAEAARMSREELMTAVEALRRGNLVVRTRVLRDREAYAALREGMRESYTSVEQKQESITNTLMRRLDAAKRVKGQLAASLAAVEEEKAREELRLQVTQRNIARLTKHLKREESVVGSRMQEQLQYLQSQHDKLKRLVDEQSDSLQQLEELVNEVQALDVEGGGGGVGGAAAMPSTPPSRRDSTLSKASSSAHAAGLEGRGGPHGIRSPPNAPAPAPAPAQAQAQAQAHARTSSQFSSSASTSAVAHVPPSELAYSPRAMVGYLEQEISSVEVLRSEVLRRAEAYALKCRRLEERVARELRDRHRHQQRVEDMKQELSETSTAVRELSVQQELSMEVESERRLNAAVRCDSQSRATHPSSAPNTPRGVALGDALLVPAPAKYMNPAAVEAFRAAAATAAAAVSPTVTGATPGSPTPALATASVDLADVVLVPGTERYAIPAERIAALSAQGTGQGPLLVQPYVPTSQRGAGAGRTPGSPEVTASTNVGTLVASPTPVAAVAGSAATPSLFDALLVPGAEKYTLAVDPRNVVAAGLLPHGPPALGRSLRTQSASSRRCASERAEEGTAQPASQRISVQHTTRMSPPRPLSSTEGTPRKSASLAATGYPPALDLDGQ